MPSLSNQSYLEHEQYKDASHLNVRIQLHQRFSTNHYGWFKWVFDQLILSAVDKFLEVGCGPGTLWVENKHRIPANWHIHLSDFSPGMISNSKACIGKAPNYFEYCVSNGMAIPFQNETFDTVIANHVIYHFSDCQRALGEIDRVLKPGGYLFASTIGEKHLLELTQLMDGFAPTEGNYYSPALNPIGFTLENGAEQLAPWFSQIEIRCYPDELLITEAEPLVAYIDSMIHKQDPGFRTSDVTELSVRINGMIKQNGSIRIQKSSGMFICKKGGKE